MKPIQLIVREDGHGEKVARRCASVIHFTPFVALARLGDWR